MGLELAQKQETLSFRLPPLYCRALTSFSSFWLRLDVMLFDNDDNNKDDCGDTDDNNDKGFCGLVVVVVVGDVEAFKTVRGCSLKIEEC